MLHPPRPLAWYDVARQTLISGHTPRQQRIWLALSLFVATIYGCWAVWRPLTSPYTVQNDVRQHVFWLRQFLDPELFAGDRIVDYFESVAPAGYTAFYRCFMALGVDPVELSKILPLFLGLATTAYCFYLATALLPVPLTGFIAAVLLNQTVWLRNDISSATPRAFVYVFFLAFLYYLLQRQLWPCLAAIALLGLFYPQYALLAGGVASLRLVVWQGYRPKLQLNWPDLRFNVALLLAMGAIVGLFALKSSEFGPVVTAAAARQMPEFWDDGRTEVFETDMWKFFLSGGRTGLIPHGWLTPVPMAFGLLLPWLAARGRHLVLPEPILETVAAVQARWQLLLQVVISATGLYALAHLLLFRLHLPSRYTNHSFRIAIAMAAAIVLTLAIDGAYRWTQAHPTALRQVATCSLTAALLVVLAFYPSFLERFPNPRYSQGKAPELYRFLQQQPKDILVASLSREADFLPTHGQRSVLASWRLQSPYHVGYHTLVRQRITDLIAAQYALDLASVRAFITRYGVDFWLLDRAAFKPRYLETNRWFGQWQEQAERVRPSLVGETRPALLQGLETCSVLESEAHILLSAECLLQL